MSLPNSNAIHAVLKIFQSRLTGVVATIIDKNVIFGTQTNINSIRSNPVCQ